jgi:hypothetical protein
MISLNINVYNFLAAHIVAGFDLSYDGSKQPDANANVHNIWKGMIYR